MAKAGQMFQTAARVFAALGLMFLSFSHQPVAARQMSPAATADYLLPDGTIADICFGMDGVEIQDDHVPHEAAASVCDYCRLCASVLLPSPPGVSFLVVHDMSSRTYRSAITPVFVAHPRLLPPSRAPPVLI